jgi:hypothetical protein
MKPEAERPTFRAPIRGQPIHEAEGALFRRRELAANRDVDQQFKATFRRNFGKDRQNRELPPCFIRKSIKLCCADPPMTKLTSFSRIGLLVSWRLSEPTIVKPFCHLADVVPDQRGVERGMHSAVVARTGRPRSRDNHR